MPPPGRDKVVSIFLQFFFAEFEVWKSTVEELECCSFVKMSGGKVTEKHEEVQYFNCNRCGMYRPSGKGMRLTKSQGKLMVSHVIHGITP